MTTHIAILGRQPAISMAELECVFGGSNVEQISPSAALIRTSDLDIQKLGGTIKAGQVLMEVPRDDWATVKKKVIQHYTDAWKDISGKQTIGASIYDWRLPPKSPSGLLMQLKSQAKALSVSVRTIPNNELALNTAASHHNKLGLSANKIELLIVRTFKGSVVIAESVGAQNITALAARDQARPKTDAFVGMLPPKLAQMMVNMSTISSGTILDPFCGTGVVLQEAMLLGLDAVGTDLSDKMIDYSVENLTWLRDKHRLTSTFNVTQGDAMNTIWTQPLDAVVAETYLGQPFSAPPSPNKLKEVQKLCDYIISEFLKNIHPQLTPNTPLVLAVPAWRDVQGNFSHLSFTRHLENLGYEQTTLKHVRHEDLLYYRENQVVARKLLLLTRL